MKPVLFALFASALSLSSIVPQAALADEPIVLKDMGSFFVGGTPVDVSGKAIREAQFMPGADPVKIDPNGQFMTGQMYVQYFVPQNLRGSVPMLTWHGGGLTGVTYESTPDGREGWLNYFLRRGWAVYNSDAVERGRSGFAPPEIFPGEPTFLAMQHRWQNYRIGTGEGSYSSDPLKRQALPGTQFPVEAYDNFVRQGVPRWTTTNDLILAAYDQEIEKVCPCVLLVHSQSGLFGFEMAQRHPDKIRALVAIEPSGIAADPQPATFKNIPLLAVYGDFIEPDSNWGKHRTRLLAFAENVRKEGGSVDIVNLTDQGINGNGHMMMMDKNNGEIADIIQTWLEKNELYN